MLIITNVLLWIVATFILCDFKYDVAQMQNAGICPVPGPFKLECPPPEGHELSCLIDDDCNEQEKCCSDGCNLRCTGLILEFIELNNNPCLLDTHCTTGKKCCLEGCNSMCDTSPKNTETCDVPVDLGIFIDVSTSIGGVINFIKILKIVGKIVHAFEIYEQGTHIGVIYFSDHAVLHFDFNTFRGNNLTKELVINEIYKAPYRTGFTRIDLALALAKQKLFTIKNGMRPEKSKIAMVITDGRQDSGESKSADLDKHSRPLKEMGVQVYALAVGESINMNNLRNIASDDDCIFHLKDFNELYKKVSIITETLCKNALEMCSA